MGQAVLHRIVKPGLFLVVACLMGAAACAGQGAPALTSGIDSSDLVDTTSTSLALSSSTIQTVTTTTIATTTTTPRGRLVVHGVGDVNLDGDVVDVLRRQGYDHAWSGLDGLFLEDDLSIVNLECSPSPDGPREPKQFVFGCDIEAYPAMVAAGVDVAGIGNNHSQDHGKEAMLVGRDLLVAAGLNPVGAGVDASQAGEPAYFEINGWTVAVVGFGGVFPHEGWFATDDRPGMRDGDTIETMVAAVEEADRHADLVFVTIHWGVELDLQPRSEDRARAEAMVAAGADAIFGHHPHRLQPLETVGGRPVAWSLGNFVWPKLSDAGSTTAVARVVVDPEGTIEACLIPAYIESEAHPILTAEPSCGPPLP